MVFVGGIKVTTGSLPPQLPTQVIQTPGFCLRGLRSAEGAYAKAYANMFKMFKEQNNCDWSMVPILATTLASSTSCASGIVEVAEVVEVVAVEVVVVVEVVVL